MKKLVVFILGASLLISALSFAKGAKYQVVEVKNGGSIKGKIKSAEKVQDPVISIKVKPKENPKETELEKQTCGDSQQAMMYVLSPVNEVKNVLVIVEGVTKGKALPKQDLVIDNIKCRFDPLVGITYVKSNYVVKNSDPILHNTSLGKMLGEGTRRAVYNLALPYKDQVIEKPNRVSGLIDVKCDAHPWMRAYVYSSEHPYVAITDANGNYEIKDILPGKYTVRFWHEGFEEVVKDIEVKANSVSEVNVSFTKTKKPDFMGRI
jgi:hypothetical protein